MCVCAETYRVDKLYVVTHDNPYSSNEFSCSCSCVEVCRVSISYRVQSIKTGAEYLFCSLFYTIIFLNPVLTYTINDAVACA